MSEFKHKVELECAHCGERIWSKWSGHFESHTCTVAGLIGKLYNHDRQAYEAAYPYIAIDETEYCCRYIGERDDFIIHDSEDSDA